MNVFRYAALLLFSAVCVAQQAPALSYVRSLAGSASDTVAGIATDPAGNVYVAGTTFSPDFPIKGGLQPQMGSSTLFQIDPAAGFRKLPPAIASDILALATDPRDSSVLFAGTPKGLFRTTDGAATWQVIGDLPKGRVTSLAVDPSNSSVLYASVPSPGGLFKSTDGGATWQPSSNGIPAAQARSFSTITIDPNQPSIVLLDSFRSEDGGQTWSPLLVAGDRVSFVRKRPGLVYAATYPLGGVNLRGISKSTDSGRTWTALPIVEPGPTATGAVLADPDRPGTLYVPAYRGIWKSTNEGQSWSLIVVETPVAKLAADPNAPVLYAATYKRVIASSDGFNNWSVVTPTDLNVIQALAVGPGRGANLPGKLFVGTKVSSDAFVAKYDLQGNLIYSTFLGGSRDDSMTAIAADAQGSAYVAGITQSSDFPLSGNAYQRQLSNSPCGYEGGCETLFVAKLSPDGAVLAYSTLFANALVQGSGSFGSSVSALAVDAQGSAYLAGSTQGGLPTTSGVVQPNFQALSHLGSVPGLGPRNAFVTKFNREGSGLVYSTYLGFESDGASALAVDSDGNAYAAGTQVWKLNADATSLVYAKRLFPAVINAIALDDDRNLYVAGFVGWNLPISSDAFQAGPRRPNVVFQGDTFTFSGGHPFVAKLDTMGTNVLYSTFVAGSGVNYTGSALPEKATGIAVDSAGNAVVVGTTISSDFPLRTTTQCAFAPFTSWVAKLNRDGSDLIYSTYAGDIRPFAAAGVALDRDGNPVFAGHTIEPPSYGPGDSSDVLLSRLDTSAPAPAVRLDEILNSASLLGGPTAPGAYITVRGAGFGSDARVLFDGLAGQVFFSSDRVIQAMVPASRPTGAVSVQVEAGGQRSNPAWLLVADNAPAVFTQSGDGTGAGLIFNEDDTLNSASNPAPAGSVIRIVTNGVGSGVLSPSVKVLLGGAPASILGSQFAETPGVPGPALQIQARIGTVSSTSADRPTVVGVALQIGGIISPPGVALYLSYP